MLAMHPLIENLAPEITLLVGAAVIFLGGLSKRLVRGSAGLAVIFVLLSLLAAAGRSGISGNELVGNELHIGPLTWYVRLVTLLVGVLIILANRHVPEDRERGEYFALILSSLAGVSLVAVANNLVLLFLALELVSVPTYILIGISRRDLRSQEATGKYFFLGAFAAAIMLYGFSFLYGATGTTVLFGRPDGLHVRLTQVGAMSDTFVVLGLVLSLAGLTFKIAAVPFHFYAADVYQGAASPVAGLLGFVPKIAGFVAMLRLLSLGNWSYAPQEASVGHDALFWLFWVLAAATMTFGNTLALLQQNVKRMLAYSSIAHSGYMLVAVVAGPGLLSNVETSPLRNGITALLFYIAVYGVMNLGAFAALSFFRKPGSDDPDDSIESLTDLGGAARRHPWAALALAVCVLGLMGFPLTGGFLGKVYVFSAALSSAQAPQWLPAEAASPRYAAMLALVVIGVLNSAVAAAYYLRILAACYVAPDAPGVTASRCPSLRLAVAACAVVVAGLFFRPGWLFDRAGHAVTGVVGLPHSADASADRSPPASP